MHKVSLIITSIIAIGYCHNFFKNTIDLNENIIVVKIINYQVANIEKVARADAQILKILKGDIKQNQIKLKSVIFKNRHFTDLNNYTDLINGEIAILFLHKNNFNNLYTIKNSSIMHTKLMTNKRYVILPYNIMFPYRIFKNMYMPIDTNNDFGNKNRYAPFDTVINTITELINDPPLLYRKDCKFIFCAKYPQSRSFEVLEQYFQDNPSLNDVDRIAICDFKFNIGVSEDVIRFVIGKPTKITKFEKDKEKWEYKGLTEMIFNKQKRVLLKIN